MSDPVARVLGRLDAEPPSITNDEAATWPDGELNLLLDARLIREEKRAQWIDCDSCADPHRGRVQWLPGDPRRAFISCPENGRVEIELLRLRRWGVDLARLAELLAAGLTTAGVVEELVPSRLWRLGRIVIGGRTREVFLGRRLGEPDGVTVIGECARLQSAAAPFVLVAEFALWRNDANAGTVPVVALSEMVTLQGDALVVDRRYLESALGTKAIKKEKPARSVFPTPRGAKWRDVEVRVRDRESVSVKVGTQRRYVTYVEMGMSDQRSARPDKQWELLLSFAAEDGALTWGNSDAHRKNMKRVERLAAALRRFFELEGEPIGYVESTKGWRTRFRLRGE